MYLSIHVEYLRIYVADKHLKVQCKRFVLCWVNKIKFLVLIKSSLFIGNILCPKTQTNHYVKERQMSMVSNFIVHLQIPRDLAREREDNARNKPIIFSAPDLNNLFGHDSSF